MALSDSSAKFISFEGSEGVGKTTAIDGLCQYLTAKNIAFVRTREPGGTPFAELLRARLLDNTTQMSVDTELLTIFTARADHLAEVILPNLTANRWVICDRFVDSTVAYQGFGRYHGVADYLAKIELLTRYFVPRLPDLTFWLDLDVAKGLARAGRRGTPDRFESETLDFFYRVQQGFIHQATTNPAVVRIDADGTKETVLAQIIAKLEHAN